MKYISDNGKTLTNWLGYTYSEGYADIQVCDMTDSSVDPQYLYHLTCLRWMDLLQAFDEMKAFIQTAQKLIEMWERDPDNYSKLEEGLTAMKVELQKFHD